MSSHHIVRDEQEPAVIITELKTYYWKTIDQLLGWAPTVIVATGCVEAVLLRGIKIDVVVGTSEHLAQIETLLIDQQPLQKLQCETKDLLRTAVGYLLENNYKAVNIFGEFESIRSMDRVINKIWYDDQRYVKSTHGVFKKWLPEETLLRIIPSEAQQEFKVKGISLVSDLQYSSDAAAITTISSDNDFWVGERYT